MASAFGPAHAVGALEPAQYMVSRRLREFSQAPLRQTISLFSHVSFPHSGPSWETVVSFLLSVRSAWSRPPQETPAWVHVLRLPFAGNGRHLDGFLGRIPPSPELAILWGGCRVSMYEPTKPTDHLLSWFI